MEDRNRLETELSQTKKELGRIREARRPRRKKWWFSGL